MYFTTSSNSCRSTSGNTSRQKFSRDNDFNAIVDAYFGKRERFDFESLLVNCMEVARDDIEMQEILSWKFLFPSFIRRIVWFINV